MSNTYAVCRQICTQLLKLLARVEVCGRERVPVSGPVVLCPTHASILDPPLIMSVLRRQVLFMAAAYLFDIPVLGQILRLGGAVPVQGVRSSLSAMRRALKVLEDGGAVVVFPQGGVRGEDEPIRLHRGSAFVASAAGAPILPVVISGSEEVLPPGTYLPRRGTIKITFGELIPAAEQDLLHTELEDALRCLLASDCSRER